MPGPAIAVTGVGMCSSLGRGMTEHWQALIDGRQGHRLVTRSGRGPAGPVPLALLDPKLLALAAQQTPDGDTTTALAALVARDALAQAGLAPAGLGLVVGTSNGGLLSRRAYRDGTDRTTAERLVLLRRSAVDQAATDLGRVLGTTGPRVTVSTACASSTHAVGVALGWLRRGDLDAVLVVGVDMAPPMVAAGFDALGVLGARPCTPFSLPVGMSLGEGAAAWVLQVEPPADRVLAWVPGFGSSADGVHPTAPDPSGAGMARAVRAALRDAAVAPGQVDLYSAQGTGTEANDAAETLAVRRVFGDRVPVTSGKGHLGHCQGAGGLLEASLVLGGMTRGALPPTSCGTRARSLAPPDVVRGEPRTAELAHAVKHSAAFGGANATLVLARDPGPTRERPPVEVGIVGTAALRPTPGGGPLSTPARSGRLRLGTLDPTGRYLVAAVGAALPEDHDETWGLIAGVPGLQAASGTAWQTSLVRRAASGRSFSQLVRNAGTGAACLAHGLRGPCSTICSGTGTGLLALLHGLDLLAGDAHAAGVVVAAADEVGQNTRDLAALDPVRRAPFIEAAAAVALGRGVGVPVLGTGLAGPGELAGAVLAATGGSSQIGVVWSATDGSADADRDVSQALSKTGLGGAPQVRMSERLGHAPAASALVAVVEGCAAIAAGECSSALVVSGRPDGFAVALLLGARR